jgi:hypothetical protein
LLQLQGSICHPFAKSNLVDDAAIVAIWSGICGNFAAIWGLNLRPLAADPSWLALDMQIGGKKQWKWLLLAFSCAGCVDIAIQSRKLQFGAFPLLLSHFWWIQPWCTPSLYLDLARWIPFSPGGHWDDASQPSFAEAHWGTVCFGDSGDLTPPLNERAEFQFRPREGHASSQTHGKNVDPVKSSSDLTPSFF